MKSKGKPESRIPTTKTNKNKRKTFEGGNERKKIDMSLFRKNEFALIVLGALLLTIIIFFLFFRSPGPGKEPVKNGLLGNTTIADLEKRIKSLEQALQVNGKTVHFSDDQTTGKVQEKDPLTARVTRLETAFSVKFDSLIERMGNIENSISDLKNKLSAAAKAKPAAKPSIPVKKAIKKDKKTAIFHTVKKGETLYSISKKYNTSIAALRKLNNLTAKAKIYPGDNILIR